ncbi:putative LacI transcriptional regulator domain protein [Collimonas pratensis]|uniref:LacI transcriptional regulator domain protein n=1 Tax=Collimonas pratensis TaxID=279113 RepID=A0ABM5Z0W3_9BURK|nr:putative LacI transcriptional regulator domain protein [Collimonas pratensis]
MCQERAEISFRSCFREYAPEFQLLETLISLEDIHLVQVATLDLLKRHPDLAGIYVWRWELPRVQLWNHDEARYR